LAPALERAAVVSPKILVEEMIRGHEATVGVVDNYRGQEYYTLMPVEIVPPPGRFFDYEVKYNGATKELVPSTFSDTIKKELERVAALVHRSLGMRHYSRSDFIVTPRGAVYFLEINNPQAVGMTSESLMPKALAAGGTSLSEFLDHIVQLLLRK
jgi:D-alanine-D-alanine ligase